MKCKTCGEDVHPKFAHAISTNICPFCGQDIMDSDLQLALTDLKEVMSAVEHYPVEIYDWLKCNYQLVPQNSVDELTEKLTNDFTSQLSEAQAEIVSLKEQLAELANKPRNSKPAKLTNKDPNEIAVDKDGNALEGDLLQDPETTNKFFKNANVKNPGPQAHLKNIVDKIKKHGIDPGGTPGIITEDMIEGEGLGEVGDMSILFDDGSSSSEEDSSDDIEEIPRAVLAMAQKASNKGNSHNAKDLETLKNMQRGVAARSKQMQSGGTGLIRRS